LFGVAVVMRGVLEECFFVVDSDVQAPLLVLSWLTLPRIWERACVLYTKSLMGHCRVVGRGSEAWSRLIVGRRLMRATRRMGLGFRFGSEPIALYVKMIQTLF